METLETVLNGIQRNSYFTSCDMTDAYFSIPIHNDYKNILNLYGKISDIILTVCVLELRQRQGSLRRF